MKNRPETHSTRRHTLPFFPIYLIAIAVLFSIPARSENFSLSLQDAVILAIKQNPDVLLSRLDEKKSQQAILEAKDPFFPKVIVGSGLAYTSGFPLSIEGSAPSIVRADAIQSLFNREKKWQVEKFREQARGAGIDREAKQEEVVLNTAIAYLDTLRARRIADAARQQLTSLEQIAETMQVRIQEGRELPLEGKKIAARVAQARYQLNAFSRQAEYQEAFLAILLGYQDSDRVIPVADERSPLLIPENEDSVIQSALDNSPKLKSLESRIQATGLEIKAYNSARLPKMDLVAQYGLFAKFNNYDKYYQHFQRHNGQLGVSFQIPVLAGSAASARKQQSESQAARLRIELAHTRNQIRLETRRIYQDIQVAESLREATRLDFDSAREQVSVLMAQMEEGRAGLRQLEEAKFLENQKWSAYLDSQHQLEKLKFSLLKETGELLAALNIRN